MVVLIKDQLINICWSGNNRVYYEEKGCVFTKYRGLFKIDVKDLPPKSNKRVLFICDYCDCEFDKAYCDYTISLNKSLVKKDACKNCKVKKSRETVKLKYGVEHQSQLNWVIEKIKNSEKLSIERVLSAFEERDCTFTSKEYINAKEKIEYICNKHPKITNLTTLDNFKSAKYVCDKCREISSDEKMFDKYKVIAIERKLELLSIIRENDSVFLSLMCNKHKRESKVLTSNFKNQKYTCRDCAYKVSSSLKRNSFEYILDTFENKGYTLLNIEDYTNNKTALNYICNEHEELGIQTTNFSNAVRAKVCRRCCYSNITGENHYLWKGGISPLHNHLRDKINEWKRESLASSNYKCVVTSEGGELVIHHTYGFNIILNEVLKELNLNILPSAGAYSESDLASIEELIVLKHQEYGLGVPIKKNVHNLFHKIYGKGNNTPEQFEEFKQNYIDGMYEEAI